MQVFNRISLSVCYHREVFETIFLFNQCGVWHLTRLKSNWLSYAIHFRFNGTFIVLRSLLGFCRCGDAYRLLVPRISNHHADLFKVVWLDSLFIEMTRPSCLKNFLVSELCSSAADLCLAVFSRRIANNTSIRSCLPSKLLSSKIVTERISMLKSK